MKLLAPNRQALQARHRQALQRIQAVSDSDLRRALQRTGFDPFTRKRDGVTILPYGTDAEATIQRWLGAIHPQPHNFIATAGLGDGRHLEAFLKRFDNLAYLLCLEHSPAHLAHLFATRDCSALLNHPRFFLACGEPDDACFDFFEDVQFAELERAQLVLFAPLHAFHENAYNDALQRLADTLEVRRDLYFTNVGDSALLQENAFANAEALLPAPDVSVLQNAFDKVPLILVGAGPSLDEAVDFLKAARERALIVCSNSSYRKLRNNGIVPHLVGALDPKPSTDRGFEGQPLDGTCLVAPFFVFPGVAERFPGRTFTWSADASAIEFLKRRLGLKPGTRLLQQGTISASLVDLAKILGCPKICLVGQDMALTADGQNHTADSFYADEDSLITSTRRCRHLPGNTLETVPVDPALYVYLRTFQKLAAEHAGTIGFCNTARLGARIHGVPYLDYDAALEWLGPANFDDPSAVLEQALSSASDQRQALLNALPEALTPLQRFGERLLEAATRAAVETEALPERLAGATYARHADVRRHFAAAESINTLLDRYPAEYAVFFEGRAKAELVDCLKAHQGILSAARETTEAPHWLEVRKNRAYFWALAEAAFHFVQLLATVSPPKHEATSPTNRAT
ncbi:MAG: motility associated factor glycosyltransferase family protein [Opitutales bacterium]